MSRVEELENEIKGLENRKIELLKELEVEKQKFEIVHSLEIDDIYYTIDIDGDVFDSWWGNDSFDKKRSRVGNVFYTRQEAEKERDRRILLTRFKQFRDKCNGDWKPFEHGNQFYISFDTMTNVIHTNCVYINKSFALFGYFKNKSDAERAIELFGDEIKRLWVDE